MPSKVKAAAATAATAAPAATIEQTELKLNMKTAGPTIVIAEKHSSDLSQQCNSAENKTVNICEETLQSPKQTIETTAVLRANLRNKLQPQPDSFVIYPQYQSCNAPSMNAFPVPGATTSLPGQQQELQCQTQFSPSYQVAFHPPMISGEAYPVLHNEHSYQMNYEFPSQPLQTYSDMQFCEFGWQYHSPSMMSPHQLYADPCQRFNQFQQAAVIPTLRTPYSYTAFQKIPNDPTKRHLSYKSRHQSDSSSSSFACQKGFEHRNCDCEVQAAGPVLKAPKESEKTNLTNNPSIPVESASANHTRSVKSNSNDFSKRQTNTKDFMDPASDVMQNLSKPSSPPRPIETTGNREWYNREILLSSDSGWISDNSSNKEDGELVDDASHLSPPLNEISSHFQNNLCLLENNTSSSADESYQESQSSGISSQCPSTSDDTEHQRTPTKKHSQQPRVMKAIPARFVHLLHSAAENAAVQRKRVEGYPLFRQLMPQRRHEDHQQDLTYGSEMQHLEFSVSNQPNQSTSWYFPGSYVQFQHHQNPLSYLQGQYLPGAGTCSQGPYHQGGSGGYIQGLYQQGPGGYMQNIYQQGSESYVQSHYNQGIETYLQSPYSPGSSGCTYSDQQYSQEYCPAVPAVPVYVIQVDNPDVAKSCTMYNDGRSYTSSSSQGVCEKFPQSYTCHSNSSYVNPVLVQ